MTAPPLKINIGTAPDSGTKDPYQKFIAAHPGLQKYAPIIAQWAGTYNVPALWVAAIIWKESKGQNVPWNQSVQGAGVAQLNISPNGKGSPPASAAAALGRPLTYADAMNPNTAIQVLAYSMIGASDPDSFYTTQWNPHFKPSAKNPLPSSYLKGYVVKVSGETPQQSAAKAAADAQAKAQNLIDAEQVAKGTIDPIYLAYAGRKATQAELKAYAQNPTSTYEIQQRLSNPKINPGIYKSPVWQTNEGRYTAWYQQVYGPEATPPKSVILDGIVHNKDQAGFAADLRNGSTPGAPAYTSSEEYKGNYADAQKVYSNIYGAPDEVGQQFLQKAVLGGWNQSQIENYLRAQPEYQSSPEYQRRAMNLAQSMGLIPRTYAAGANIGQTALAGIPPAGATNG